MLGTESLELGEPVAPCFWDHPSVCDSWTRETTETALVQDPPWHKNLVAPVCSKTSVNKRSDVRWETGKGEEIT